MSSPGGPLVDERGRLRAPGWALEPVWRYDGAAVGRRLRRKEWDFYGVTTRDHYVAIVIAHVGFAGIVALQWIDLAARRCVIERVALTPLGRGIALPASSETGDVRVARRDMVAEVAHEGARRHLCVAWSRGRRVAIELELGAARGIAVAAPLGGGRGFYYNHKVPALPARGAITVDGARTTLDGFATLDWGRGVWPYRTSWRWAAAQGRLADGRRVGLTLGDVSADAGAAREDALLVDDVLTKLAPVRIDFDRDDAMRPWRITGERVELVLEPRFDSSRTLQLGVARTQLRAAIGTIRGAVTTDAGERIAIDVPGWAEEHLARW